MLLQALGAAKNIRKIVTTCCHNGVPIRWFKYNQKAAVGGHEGFLEPLNATQVAKSRLSRLTALHYLALTTANRESLTFCSPQLDDFPGVIFSADSDLQFPQPIPWQQGMIVTVPHHGSCANKASYQRPASEYCKNSSLIWVRSDGNFKSRPCRAYLSLQKNVRHCTICRGVNPPKQKQCVQFTAIDGKWLPVNGVRTCECK